MKVAELMKVMTILHAWKFRANTSLFSIYTIKTMEHTWMCLIQLDYSLRIKTCMKHVWSKMFKKLTIWVSNHKHVWKCLILI